MIMTNLQAHIDELAFTYNIAVDQRFALPGMMFVEEQPPRIEIPTLKACPIAPSVNICYMVAMHEIGHVVNGHTQGRPPFQDRTYYFDHGVLRCEAEAWNFALDEHKATLTKNDCAFMANRYIGSYIQGARNANGKPRRLGNGNRHWVEFTYDNPDDPYVQDTVSRLRDAWKNNKGKNHG